MVEQGRNNVLGNNTWVLQTFPIQMADADNYVWAVGYDYAPTVNVQYRQASLIYRTTTGLQIVEDNDIIKSWRIEGMSARGATQQTRYIIKY